VVPSPLETNGDPNIYDLGSIDIGCIQDRYWVHLVLVQMAQDCEDVLSVKMTLYSSIDIEFQFLGRLAENILSFYVPVTSLFAMRRHPTSMQW
jgi:hypothetical protein